jgi:hypothetical protein
MKKMAYRWYYCLCKVSKHHLCKHAAIQLLATKVSNITMNKMEHKYKASTLNLRKTCK